MESVYLDHLSGNPVLAEVVEAMEPFHREPASTSAAPHSKSLRVRDRINWARAQLAQLINAESEDEIVFVSDATEAANLGLRGFASKNKRFGNHIVSTTAEQPAVSKSLDRLEAQGFRITRVGVDGEGRFDPAGIAAELGEDTILVATHIANLDTGCIQPVEDLAARCQEQGTTLFLDGDGSVGWLPLQAAKLGLAMISFSANRFYGPRGIGILYRQRRVGIEPIIQGGDQEFGLRGGLENIPAMVGAGVAALQVMEDGKQWVDHVAWLQQHLTDRILGTIDHVRLIGPEPGTRRLPTTLNIAFEFVEGEGLMLALDTRGIIVGSGMVCGTKAQQEPLIFNAIDLPPSLSRSNLLFSPGRQTSVPDADRACEELFLAVDKLRGMSPSWEAFQRGEIPSVTAN